MGQTLNRNRWTALPMPADVIERLHTLACETPSHDLIFTDHNNVPENDPDIIQPSAIAPQPNTAGVNDYNDQHHADDLPGIPFEFDTDDPHTGVHDDPNTDDLHTGVQDEHQGV